MNRSEDSEKILTKRLVGSFAFFFTINSLTILGSKTLMGLCNTRKSLSLEILISLFVRFRTETSAITAMPTAMNPIAPAETAECSVLLC